MAISFNVSTNVRNARASGPRFDPDQLPSTYTAPSSKAGGCFLIPFALLWGGIPTGGLVAALVAGKFHPAMLFLLCFTVIGLGLLALGIHLLFATTQYHLAPDFVGMRSHGLFGRKEWREPIGNYQGVLVTSETRSTGGKHSSTYTVYVIKLHHPDPKRVLVLSESLDEGGQRPLGEQWCRRLNRPALEPGGPGGGYVTRAVEDLDKSVRDLVQEGKLQVRFDPRARPPEPLAVQRDGDAFDISFRAARLPLIAIFIMFAIPTGLIVAWALIPGAPLGLLIAGIVIDLVFTLVVVLSVVTRTRVRVSPQGVRYAQLLPWGEMGVQEFAAAEVESVRVGRGPRETADGVLIASDRATGTVGTGLPPEALAWLRDCLLATLSK